ncbi:MAG: glycerophosphodiester phosphodiesterase [Nitrospirae bacterium]|nr:glycerophosphodiester phosphodiesterase [Nitrospirota bacterium]
MPRTGHRGAGDHAPENTLASIEKAIALGCDLTEVEVRRTRDGQRPERRLGKGLIGFEYLEAPAQTKGLADDRAEDDCAGQQIESPPDGYW